jgi:dCMP deaminase
MQRDDIHTYFLKMAYLVSSRGTCRRRRVGAILVDRHSHVMATGYNGVPAGMQHCIENPCPGASSPTGTQLDLCLATHAEQNALLQCQDSMAIDTLYTTLTPCIQCVKLLLNTSCQMIVYGEQYAQEEPMKMWRSMGRSAIQLRLPNSIIQVLRGF